VEQHFVQAGEGNNDKDDRSPVHGGSPFWQVTFGGPLQHNTGQYRLSINVEGFAIRNHRKTAPARVFGASGRKKTLPHECLMFVIRRKQKLETYAAALSVIVEEQSNGRKPVVASV
jgi:hypothetical protein